MCTMAAIGRGAHAVKGLSTSGAAEVGLLKKPAANAQHGVDHTAEVKISVRHAILLGEWPHLVYYPYCIRGYVSGVNRATPFHFS